MPKKSRKKGTSAAAAGGQQEPLLENASEAFEATAGATAPASGMHGESFKAPPGAMVTAAPAAVTAAPAPASSMCEGQQHGGSSHSAEPGPYGTGIVQHGAIEELLQSRAGLMIRERLFALHTTLVAVLKVATHVPGRSACPGTCNACPGDAAHVPGMISRMRWAIITTHVPCALRRLAHCMRLPSRPHHTVLSLTQSAF